jgi:chitinase
MVSRMIERQPIPNITQLADLDLAEVIEGYNDGRAAEPEPGNNRSMSYWHGWRNGHADRMCCPDAAQLELARDDLKNLPAVQMTYHKLDRVN